MSDILPKFSRLINNYNLSFQPISEMQSLTAFENKERSDVEQEIESTNNISTTISTLDDQVVTMPNPPKNNHIASTERYKSNMEKRKEIYKNKKTTITAVKKKIISKRRCTFCKEEGHKITCYHVIGSVGIPWEDSDKLIKFITNNSPFRVGHLNEVYRCIPNKSKYI